MKYFSDFERLSKEVRLQALIIIVLLGVVFVEGILLYRASTQKTVIVVPPKVEKEFWVSGNTLSRAYLEQVAIYLADSLVSVSPQTVDSAIDRIMPFLTTEPQQLKEIRGEFLLYAKSVKDNDWYQVFYPMKVIINDKHQKIAVQGMLRKMTGDIYVGQEQKTVEFTYEIRDGRLYITGVKF